jgi:hypothetical protein
MPTPEISPPGTPLPEEMLNYNIDEIDVELKTVTNEIIIFENEINNINNNNDKKIINNMLEKLYDKKLKILRLKNKLTGDKETQPKFITELISKLDRLKIDQGNKADLEEQERGLKEQDEQQYNEQRYTKGGKRIRRPTKRRNSKRRKMTKRRKTKRRK